MLRCSNWVLRAKAAANAKMKRIMRCSHVSVSSIKRHKNKTVRGAYSAIRHEDGVAGRF